MLSKNQLKEIQSLQLKKFRDARRLFIAEGVKTILEIINFNSELIKEIYATKDFINSFVGELTSQRVIEITDVELKKISLQITPNKVLAVCNYFSENKTQVKLDKNFSLYLDDVRDPGNFGTIIRLCAWFGIQTIYCSPNSCDFYNPKVIQATMGAFLRVEVIYVELDTLLVQGHFQSIYGAVLNGRNLYKEKLVHGLIVIGNEANGISPGNLSRITHPITIPSGEGNNSESLNAAMATSIIAAEFFRQLKC